MADATREKLEPHLVHLIASLKRGDVELAVQLLLDYIDAKAAPVPAPVIGESEAAALFKTFVRDNAKALRMVANWGDGECGWLHEVLLNELQGKSLFVKQDGKCNPDAMAGASQAAGSAPLFPEDGGVAP